MTDLYARHPTSPADTPEIFSICSSDVDEARCFLLEMYYPIAIHPLAPGAEFEVRASVIRLGPLTIGQLQFAAPVALTASAIDGYHVTLPLTGKVHTRQAGHEVLAVPERAAIFRPGRSVRSRPAPDAVQLEIKIDQAALEDELTGLLGHPIDGSIDFSPEMDMTTGPGRTWHRLIQLIRAEAEDQLGLLYEPLIAEQLRHSILSGLLLTVPHRYSDELVNPMPFGPPRAIRRAVDAMNDGPERQFCVADLAAIAGMSVRSLQEGFRRHLGVTPMAYLQQIRLERAHDMLTREHPQRVTVAAVAHRWGFTHLGRFAFAYRARYGVSPSDTLRAS